MNKSQEMKISGTYDKIFFWYFHVKLKYEFQINICHLNNEMIWESQTSMPRPNIKWKLHTKDTIRIPTKETMDSKKNNSLNNTRTKKESHINVFVFSRRKKRKSFQKSVHVPSSFSYISLMSCKSFMYISLSVIREQKISLW